MRVFTLLYNDKSEPIFREEATLSTDKVRYDLSIKHLGIHVKYMMVVGKIFTLRLFCEDDTCTEKDLLNAILTFKDIILDYVRNGVIYEGYFIACVSAVWYLPNLQIFINAYCEDHKIELPNHKGDK